MQRLQPEEIERQTFPLARRGYEPEKVDAFLGVVAAYYREALRVADDDAHISTSQLRAFDSIGGQIASILATASVAAEDLKAEAAGEAQLMRRTAADDAAQTMQAATSQLAMARQLKADAQQDAEALRSEANDEVAKLRHQAQERIAAFEHESRSRIAKLEETARANVEGFLEEAQRRYDDLRIVERQSVAHLDSIQAAIRIARDALSADYSTVQFGDLLGRTPDYGYDEATSAASTVVHRSSNQMPLPVALAQLRPQSGSQNGSVRRVKSV